MVEWPSQGMQAQISHFVLQTEGNQLQMEASKVADSTWDFERIDELQKLKMIKVTPNCINMRSMRYACHGAKILQPAEICGAGLRVPYSLNKKSEKPAKYHPKRRNSKQSRGTEIWRWKWGLCCVSEKSKSPPHLVLQPTLEEEEDLEEQQAAMSRKEWCTYERPYCHQLDEDAE
ncbi:hypothetical protein OPV22_019235 [Ensete ventricosum]|uniref:Uncharacterized protein n=1 Tax=Ensete ventricosum TaxID=4639 RepID=A0AAV8QHA3_ENSVE|nr:hypothetical protein OPV22_019235 [Ensete ventricosum]